MPRACGDGDRTSAVRIMAVMLQLPDSRDLKQATPNPGRRIGTIREPKSADPPNMVCEAHVMTFPVAMLVECDTEIRTPLATKLRQRGLQIIEARSTTEAYGLAEFGRIDVVIATQTFADHDRFELRSCLRATPGPTQLPLVLLSTEGEADTTIASAIVPETCDVDELVAVLMNVVDGQPKP
jgi:CheY-like chemotaxis protein